MALPLALDARRLPTATAAAPRALDPRDAFGASAADPLDALRRRIADVVDGTAADDAPRGFPTGVAALDAALAATGGVPRARLTELLGAPGAGTTTLARRLVAGALAAGAWVAYVDATRTLAARDWASPAADGVRAGRLSVVRPPDAARAAWCADVLLRSGTFGLVVLDGAPVLPRAVALRLLQLAREADAALVLVGHGPRASDIGGALRLRVRAAEAAPPLRPRVPRPSTALAPQRWRPPEAAGGGGWCAVRRSVITVEKGGTHGTVEVSCAVGVARRLCAHPEVPDRRPVARPAVGRVAPGTALGRDAAGPAREPAGASPPPRHAVRRGRRAAESTYGRR